MSDVGRDRDIKMKYVKQTKEIKAGDNTSYFLSERQRGFT
jgi:hypothetical protein